MPTFAIDAHDESYRSLTGAEQAQLCAWLDGIGAYHQNIWRIELGEGFVRAYEYGWHTDSEGRRRIAMDVDGPVRLVVDYPTLTLPPVWPRL